MQKLKVAIVGSGEDLSSIFKMIKDVPEVEISGLYRTGNNGNTNSPGNINDIQIKMNLDEIALNSPDVVILSGKDEHMREKLRSLIKPNTSLLDTMAVELITSVLRERERLLEFKKVQSELAIILNSVHEAIEVADINGIIKYVNPAFTRITGISEHERVGENILEVSPDGALATVLKTGQNVYGYRTRVGGSESEVISNAAPIFLDGVMIGGVVVFQHITDVMKLMEELRNSTHLIENLSEKLGQVTTSQYTFNDILGTSKEIRKCITFSERASRTDANIILLGESGTGKERFAHAIHHASPRRDHPFIKVNCATIKENLLESELFGYARGAFDGAVKSRIGKLELANGGTLFLDEIGDISPGIQKKLLKALQNMEFKRLGGDHTIRVDVRVIATTNRNLRELVKKGAFNESLFKILNGVEITIPPLRSHKEDISMLSNYLINKYNRKLGKKVKGLDKDAEELLYGYDWPGNVRELKNILERVMVTTKDDMITKKDLIQHVSQFRSAVDIIPIDQMEQILIKKAINKFGNTVEGKKRAAQALNISLATLYNKLKKYGSDNQ
ncbi:MAG: sigma-54 interaction domain-containing protein [Bacillota bacterium]